MLPQAYELPAALLLVLGGTLSCFAGYRLFKLTLAIYGFIFGAMIASSAMGASNTTGMVAAAIGGGLVGALVLMFAYFIGIAIAGAGLGALVAHAVWGYIRPGDPPPAAVIVLAILGAIGAMMLQRYVIIVATAFAGAWTVLLGSQAIASGGGLGAAAPSAAARASHVGDVWILYPTSPAQSARWLPVAWVLLGLAGTVVQLAITGKGRKK